MWRTRAQLGVEFSRDRDPHNICPEDPRQWFVGGGGSEQTRVGYIMVRTVVDRTDRQKVG